MSRKKKICLLSLCMLLLFLAVASFSVGETLARYTTQFSGITTYSPEKLPVLHVGTEEITSSCVLAPSADDWVLSGGEKDFTFDVSSSSTDRNTALRIRVFVKDDESASIPTVALTVGDTRYSSQYDYLSPNTPFYFVHQTEGWYYCFTADNEEIFCLLDGDTVSQTITVSVQNTEIDFSRIWICIDRVAA